MRLSLKDDRMFIILNKVEEKKIGRIVIPDQHSERSRIGVVMGCGPDVTKYMIGDKVLISWYTGTRIHLDGAELYGQPVDEDSFRIMRECEILSQVLED